MTIATDRLAEAIERADRNAVSYWRAVIASADAAPPFSEHQKATVRILLSGRPSGREAQAA